MELRGLDEERIDAILLEYEEELGHYSSVLESEDLATSPLPHGLDDAAELRAIEAEILGSMPSVTESAVGVPAADAKTAPRPSPPVAASGARVEAVASSPTSSPTSSPEEGAEV